MNTDLFNELVLFLKKEGDYEYYDLYYDDQYYGLFDFFLGSPFLVF